MPDRYGIHQSATADELPFWERLRVIVSGDWRTYPHPKMRFSLVDRREPRVVAYFPNEDDAKDIAQKLNDHWQLLDPRYRRRDPMA